MIRNAFVILLVITVIMVNSDACYGQENYLPGKIVDTKNDTIDVFIDYRNWEKSPAKIRYKTTLDSSTIEGLPNEVKSFSVVDEIYVSAIVQKDVGTYKVNDVLTHQNLQNKLKLVTDTVFLQTIIKGDKSLFHFKEIDDKDLFYILQEGKYELLVYYKYFKLNDEGKRYAVENTKYRGQLTLYLENLPDIQSKLRTTKYTRKGLRKLFDIYYLQKDKVPAFQKEIQNVTIETGVLVGLSRTNPLFESNHLDYLDRTEYPNSIDFCGGIFFDIRQARNNGKWSLLNELFFTKYNTSGTYTFNSYNITEDVIYTEFGFGYLKLNTMIRYRLIFDKLILFVNAGISNGYAITETNRLVDDYYVNGVLTNTTEELALSDPRRYEQGFLMGLGANVNKFSLEIRYESGNGVDYGSYDSSSPLFESAAKRLYFLIGYRFGK